MVFIVIWLACAVIGAIIGKDKRMGGGAGFAWGLFLGIIGLIVVAASPNQYTNVAGSGSVGIRPSELLEEANKAMFKDQPDKAVDLLQDAIYEINKSSDPLTAEHQETKTEIYQLLRKLERQDLLDKYKIMDADLTERHIKERSKQREQEREFEKRNLKQTTVGISIAAGIILLLSLWIGFQNPQSKLNKWTRHIMQSSSGDTNETKSDGETFYRYAIEDCALRNDPEGTASSIGIISKGERVEFLDFSAAWCMVNHDKFGVGYVECSKLATKKE